MYTTTRRRAGGATRPGTALMVLVAMTAAVLSACVEPPPAPKDDPYGLGHRLGDRAVELVWSDPTTTAGTEFLVQRQQGGLWVLIGVTSETSFVVADLPPGELQRFRVRVADASLPWSPGLTVRYIEPVLPILRIDTDDAVPILDRVTRVPGQMRLEPNGSDVAPFEGRLEINGRGNTTWNLPKKPYRIRLAEDADLMGMGSNRHWVLLASAYDPSLLRTWIGTELGNRTDLAWTPQFRQVEVVLNGSYVGVYQLGEHVRRDAARVAIEGMGPGDVTEPAVTGGYLLEMNARYLADGAPGFATERGVRFEMKEPDAGVSAQEAYIRDYVQAFERSLFSADWTDPELGYRSRLDLASFIDHYWVRELVRDVDAFYNSTNVFKRRGGPLEFGPLWDFDRSVGGYRAEGTLAPQGWTARTRISWLPRLFSDPAFVARADLRWHQLRPAFLEVAASIDAEAAALAAARTNDGLRWPGTARSENDPAYLRAWLEARIAWIDSQVGPPPEPTGVVINEVESNDPGNPDWVELLNTGTAPVDLTDFAIKDDDDSRTDRLAGVIAPGQHLVLTEGIDFSFGLGSNDEVRVFDPTGALVDVADWSGHALHTFGRCPDGTGEFGPTSSPTPGAPNDCTPPDPDPDPDPSATVRITEWMYAGAGGEFIELTNVGSSAVDLTGWSYDDDAAIPGSFDLSGIGLLMPGESMALVEAAPATFRSNWGLCAGVKLIGPYTNNLGRADQINIFDQHGALVDRLTYGDNVIPGSPRTQNVSAWVRPEGLGIDDARFWTLSSVGDAEGSVASGGADVGSPGRSTRATVAFDPCSSSG